MWHVFRLSVRRRLLVGVLSLAFLSSVAPASSAVAASVPDPLTPGPYGVSVIEYDASLPPQISIAPILPDPSLGTVAIFSPEALRGTIYVPVGAAGARPVILFQHGKHVTCRVLGFDGLVADPCVDAPPVSEEIASWRGFAYVARILASAGFIVISVDGNPHYLEAGSSAVAWERVQIIEHTFSLLKEWNRGARLFPDGVGDVLAGKVDFTRIGLAGHSMGADAVGDFLKADRAREGGLLYPGIRAVFAIAPPDNFQGAGPVGAHYGVLIGSCDGDVEAEGEALWERDRYSAPAAPFTRSLFYITGAGHNFFNSRWDDEWAPEHNLLAGPTQDALLKHGEPFYATCAPGKPNSYRLSRGDQERVGIAIIAAFFRRYLGGEIPLDPRMTGAALLPPSACPTEHYQVSVPFPCDQIVQTTFLGPASSRLLLMSPAPDGATGVSLTTSTASGFGEPRACFGPPDDGEPVADPEEAPPLPPQDCPADTNSSAIYQYRLVWDQPARFSLDLDPSIRDISRFGSLTFRAAMNPMEPENDGLAGQDLEVSIVDELGNSARVRASSYSTALRRPPGPGSADGATKPAHGYFADLLGGVRIPLSDFHGINVHKVAAIEFRSTTPRGSVQLADVLVQEG